MSIDYVYQNYTIMIFGGESIDSLSGAIQKASGSLRGYISGLDTAKLKTVALKAATVAFEAALTLGLTFAISKLLEAFDKFAHAEEKAVEQEKKFRQETLDNIRAYNDEIKESQALSNSYVELVSTTSDLTNEKEKLLEIQDKINKGIEDQTDKVDLLNKSLSENIELTSKQRLEEAQNVISQNQAMYESIIEGENASYAAMQTYGDKDVTKAISEIEFATGKRISGTLPEQSKQLEEILKLYHDIDGYNKQYYNDVEKGKQAIDAQLADWKEIKETVDAARKTVQELTITPETQNDFNELIDSAKQLYDELNGTNNASQEFLISEKLKDVKTELYNLIGGNEELTQIADDVFSSFDKGVNSLLGDVGNLKEAWLATLDDMQKGSLKNISTMVSALQDLSENKGIAANTFWQLIEFDNEGLLNGAKLVGDRFVVTQENMIKLKDQYVQKQVEELEKTQAGVMLQKELYEQEVKRYEMELERLKLQNKPINSKEYQDVLSNLSKAQKGAREFGDEWERNNWLIRYLNQTLGNTIDLQKQLESQQKQLNKELAALEKELDNYQKAYDTKIDGIIKGLETEERELENQKETLEDELDVLEKQKNVIEDIISNYEKVNNLVQNAVQDEVKALEQQKQDIADSYNKRIEALKAENKEREDALDYAQKLKNLENAQNNKTRVYDEARGWHWASNSDDVKKAQSELSEYENRKAIEQLEAERDALIDATEDIIDSKEKYAEQWKEISGNIQDEADEELAKEILGADWREKIANGDTELLKKFTEEYRKHNSNLKQLTDTEIKLKKAEIEAKNADIKASKDRIQAWKDYKTEFSTAVANIKNANQDYMQQIGTIELDEKSSLERREQELSKFKDKVVGYINDIGNTQTQIDAVTSKLDELQDKNLTISVDVVNTDALDRLIEAYAQLADETMAAAWGKYIFEYGDQLSDEERQYALKKYAHFSTNGFSQGGVIDYTGVAMVHGRKNAPETVFNANDSAKLYELVHNTPNLMANMLNQVKGAIGKTGNVSNVMTSDRTNVMPSVSIGTISVYANNPQEFTKGLDQHLDRYFQRKLTASYTNR